MKKAITLLAIGAAAGVTIDRIALELRKPAADQFPWLRRQVNDTVNPWLLEHHIPGSAKAEIATLEHVGRKTGAAHYTPVHPTLRDGDILIPAPLGVGSQWAQNVLHTGSARLQLHETLYDLDRPELITVAETGFYPPQLATPFDRIGWRYLRMHVAGSAPGAFAMHELAAGTTIETLMPPAAPGDIPVEPKMVEREAAPA
jgi:hypothetical protein